MMHGITDLPIHPQVTSPHLPVIHEEILPVTCSVGTKLEFIAISFDEIPMSVSVIS